MTDIHLRIYCVTVPGTARHANMRTMLRKLGADHEFVYGEILDDAPVEGICMAEYYHKAIRNKNLQRQAINSYACKMAMRRAMLKFHAEGDPWGFIIQDDVVLRDDWKEKSLKAISECPEGTGAIAVCTRPGRKVQPSGWCSPWKCVNYTEPAALVSRQYALDNAEAMATGGSLSDYSYYKKYGRFGVIYSPEPFAEYVGRDSYISNLKPNETEQWR